MQKSIPSICIILLFISVICIPTIAINLETNSSTSKDNTLYVGGGQGNYSTIQSAIDNASDGDTVYVYDDSSPYYELLVITKSINLIGENRNSTIIDGDFKGIPLKINAKDCLVSGFTIKNCKKEQILLVEYAVILINNCENIVVYDNIIIIDDYFQSSAVVEGIYLNDSHFCSIQNNIIFDIIIRGHTRGISLDGGSSYNVISGNNISVFCNGIDFAYKSHNNNISNNYIYNNLHGIDIWDSDYNEILKNKLEKNEYRGIRLAAGSQENKIIGNIINQNGRGVQHDGGVKLMDEDCQNNIIFSNTFINNSLYGIVIINSSYNVCKFNNFINNEENVYLTHQLLFINTNRWSQNFWDKSRILPYVINVIGYFLKKYPFLWFNIDWFPAKEQYDI
jgi:parallel beta-helix repeat protein